MEEPFENKVRQQVERLSRATCQEIEQQVAQKRIAWYLQHPQDPHVLPNTPRRAFELLFFDYMGLSAEDLPIVRETASEIVWMSRNPCPTLSACLKLGLDTRQVCRAAYEKSTQAFLSQLDPRLRFLRSYQEIRPYAGHCLERIVRVDFAQMMELALQEALIAKEESSGTGGAVILRGNEVLAFEHDTVSGEQDDPDQHAEAHAIFQAVQTANDSNLGGSILFSTREPCPACTALAVRANLTSIVYGVPAEETLLTGLCQEHSSARAVIAQAGVMIEVIGGVLADRCKALYA